MEEELKSKLKRAEAELEALQQKVEESEKIKLGMPSIFMLPQLTSIFSDVRGG